MENNTFLTTKELNNIIEGYVMCALWSSTDNNGEPLDNGDYLPSNEFTRAYECDVTAFVNKVGKNLMDEYLRADKTSLVQFGHDFWLTRNGHGTGFWDRGLGELGERLTAEAKKFGEYFISTHEGMVY